MNHPFQIRRPWRAKLAIAFTVAWVAPSSLAHAGYRSRLGPKLEAYLAAWGNLPKRVIPVPGRAGVTRTFVPIVTEEHEADFLRRFNRRSKTVLWAQSTSDIYAKLLFD